MIIQLTRLILCAFGFSACLVAFGTKKPSACNWALKNPALRAKFGLGEGVLPKDFTGPFLTRKSEVALSKANSLLELIVVLEKRGAFASHYRALSNYPQVTGQADVSPDVAKRIGQIAGMFSDLGSEQTLANSKLLLKQIKVLYMRNYKRGVFSLRDEKRFSKYGLNEEDLVFLLSQKFWFLRDAVGDEYFARELAQELEPE
jgi:hypothetical protein